MKFFNTSAGKWLVIIVVGAFVAWWFLGRAGKLAGGVLSGNNSLTKGTPYAGGGVVGTLGAVTNVASGGVLSDIGSWVGNKAADIRDAVVKIGGNGQ